MEGKESTWGKRKAAEALSGLLEKTLPALVKELVVNLEYAPEPRVHPLVVLAAGGERLLLARRGLNRTTSRRTTRRRWSSRHRSRCRCPSRRRWQHVSIIVAVSKVNPVWHIVSDAINRMCMRGPIGRNGVRTLFQEEDRIVSTDVEWLA